VPISDDEELLSDGGDGQDKRDDAVTAVDSLLLWRQCLRSPCNVVDTTDRDVDDVRLRYGYDDGDETNNNNNNNNSGGGGDVHVAIGSWSKHHRRGLCVTTAEDDDGPSTVVTLAAAPVTTATTATATTATTTAVIWPPAVRHCLPNGDRRTPSQEQPRRRRRDNACGRLRVTMDSARLRRGTRLSAVCHSLRRLLARDWALWNEDADTAGRNEHRVFVMCELAADQRDDVGRRRRRRRVAIQVSVVRIRHYCYVRRFRF